MRLHGAALRSLSENSCFETLAQTRSLSVGVWPARGSVLNKRYHAPMQARQRWSAHGSMCNASDVAERLILCVLLMRVSHDGKRARLRWRNFAAAMSDIAVLLYVRTAAARRVLDLTFPRDLLAYAGGSLAFTGTRVHDHSYWQYCRRSSCFMSLCSAC